MSSQAESPNWVYGSKSSFSAGELTPTIEGRTDLPLYQNGAKKIINWMILPSGGLTRRPGTVFIWATQGDQAPAKAKEPDEADGSDASGSTADVSISSNSEDDLPQIREELTFVPTAQDPTSRLYRARKKRDGQAQFFDYGILDKEDAAYSEAPKKQATKK